MSYSPEFSASEHVRLYFLQIKEPMNHMFVLLTTLSQSIPDRERAVEGFEQAYRNEVREANTEEDPEMRSERLRMAEYWKQAKEQAQSELEVFRLEASWNGSEALSVAANSVAGGLIFMAHHGLKLGELHGRANHGREVRPNYRLKEFINCARNHAAHYPEALSPSQARDPAKNRLKFQKDVLCYGLIAK